MDRNALLLYLQNVRDLEVAKYKIGLRFNQDKSYYKKRLNSIQTSPVFKAYPNMKPEKIGIMFWVLLILSVMELISAVSMFVSAYERGKSFGLPIFFLVLGLVLMLFALLLKPESTASFNKRKKEAEKAVDAYNDEQRAIARKGTKEFGLVNAEWKKQEALYQTEYSKAEKILKDFYGMNILASQYRNLASAIYIYDYMSTSQASLEDTLIHEHMENGIQRIEAKLDQFIRKFDRLIYETRCIHNDNQAMIQRQIAQNDEMLNNLQTIATNTQDAAFYSELSANYSKANAYFTLANYFKD